MIEAKTLQLQPDLQDVKQQDMGTIVLGIQATKKRVIREQSLIARTIKQRKERENTKFNEI